MISVASKIFRAIILPCLALFLVFQISTATAATFCVSTAEELQAALTTVADNGEDDEIRIVQGSYYGNFVYSSSEPYGLIIKGGYERNCSSRLLTPENTVLDAQNSGAVLVLSAPKSTGDFIVEGITLQNGNVALLDGGGLYANVNGQFTLRLSTLYNNSTSRGGGGAYINASVATISQNSISNNLASGVNPLDSGGGISVNASDIIITSNMISHNRSGWVGGGIGLYTFAGGKIGRVSIYNNEITNNHSANDGGAIGIEETSGAGGDISVRNNIVTDNSAASNSGGIGITTSTGEVLLTNNLVARNSGSAAGGGIWIFRRGSLGLKSVILTNNTIHDNSANTGGGFHLIMEDDESAAYLYNNIIWNNAATLGSDIYLMNDWNRNYFPSPIYLFNNNVDQNPDGTHIHIPFPIDPSNLSNVDPLFLDPATGNYRLSEGSPCINTGSNDAPGLPATDKDGFPRIVGTSVDMGAYEYQGFINPVAGFSAYPLSGVAPLTVAFTDESTGSIDAWEWNFGDGSTSTEKNPTHTYNSPGIFSVSLTAIGDSTAWDTETKTDYITVISPDSPDLYGRCRDFHSRDFGAWIRIMLQIGNQGNQRARDFSVAFYLSDDGFTLGPLLDYSLVRGNLQPGSTRDIPMKYSSPTSLSGKYVIAVIDQENNILELDETNNEVVIRVP